MQLIAHGLEEMTETIKNLTINTSGPELDAGLVKSVTRLLTGELGRTRGDHRSRSFRILLSCKKAPSMCLVNHRIEESA